MVGKKYPIKPGDIDTSKEPRGFDTLLDYGQRCMLWGFFQFWQAKGNWKPFTHEELQKFIPQMEPNAYMTSAIIKFIEPRLESLLFVRKGDGENKKNQSYAPSHFLISTYFLWNPAEQVFK